jgi:hypothetical protein
MHLNNIQNLVMYNKNVFEEDPIRVIFTMKLNDHKLTFQ